MLGYTIDASDVSVFVDRLVWENAAATAIFFTMAKTELTNILVETIMEIAPSAGPGFPEIYQDHLIKTIYANPPITQSEAGVEIDLLLLGTYEDYARGFHRHAIGSDNKRIELPYMGQDLRNDTDVRTVFWEDKVYPTFLYEDTLYNRLEVWGNLAPEWWVLQNGSETEPYVRPVPLTELVSAIAVPRLAALYDEALQEAVNRADRGFATTPAGGLRYAVRGGNPENTGQFSLR
jgi:hypothetical protein